MLLLLLSVAAISLVYYLVVRSTKYWSKKNVKTDKVVPIFGDLFGIILGKESYVEKTQRIYNKANGDRYIGFYYYQAPALMLTSRELVKQMCVKDFDHFLDHQNEFGGDEVWVNCLAGLKGESWKMMRSTLSFSFTTSKMRLMYNLVCQNADSFVKHFIKQNKGIVKVEFGDASTRLTNDIIANNMFGVQIDSLENRNNDFYVMGRNVFDFNTLSKRFAYLFMELCPQFAKHLDISFFGRTEKNYFTNLVKETIKRRLEQNISRPDMIGLLIEARKGKEEEIVSNESKQEHFGAVKEYLRGNNKAKDLTDDDIVSQMFVFFFAGFNTVSTALNFTAYELAVNSDIQKRLIEEIDENRPKEWPPTYDSIMNMKYLDMVVTESLRKWPPGIETNRVVTKPYVIEPEQPHEAPIPLETGVYLSIPVFSFHRDPKLYPDPEKFEPERFSTENGKNIDPDTYMPFGIGPRNCIASRFALMEIKIIFFYLLSHFEIIPTEETNIPLKLNKALFTLDSINGFPLALRRRTLIQ